MKEFFHRILFRTGLMALLCMSILLYNYGAENYKMLCFVLASISFFSLITDSVLFINRISNIHYYYYIGQYKNKFSLLFFYLSFFSYIILGLIVVISFYRVELSTTTINMYVLILSITFSLSTIIIGELERRYIKKEEKLLEN